MHWVAEGPNVIVPASTVIPAGLWHRLGMCALGFEGLLAGPSRGGTQSWHVEEEAEVICSAKYRRKGGSWQWSSVLSNTKHVTRAGRISWWHWGVRR